MITVHHLGVSQCERILWLCEELELDYKIVKHIREPALAPQSLRDVPGNETGKSPFIEDSDTGVKLSESAAVADYILQTYGNGRLSIKPKDKNFADYIYWFHYSNGTLQPAMLESMFTQLAGGPEDAPIRGVARERLMAALKRVNDRMKDNKWLAGDEFTAADVMCMYPFTTQRYFGPQVSFKGYDNLLRWLKDCSERPAFKKAMEKGDPELHILIDAEPPSQSLMEVGGVESDIWKKK